MRDARWDGMAATTLRLLSYNIQAGIGAGRYRDYLTGSWRHVLPDRRTLANLDAIARLLRRYDLVGLQEVDGGSLRSAFLDQARYLAHRAGLPWWRLQTTRRVGQVSHHANALLARMRPAAVEEHRLPGAGRGALCARFGPGGEALAVWVVHLSLGRRARHRQLAYLAERVGGVPHVVVMGDFNCTLASPELGRFLAATGLRPAAPAQPTFPSWSPVRAIDHVLVGGALAVREAAVLPHRHSDHRPLAVTLELPAALAEAA